MKHANFPSNSKTFVAVLVLAMVGAASALADVVYVTTMPTNCTSTTVCGSGPQTYGSYDEHGFGNFTSAKSSVIDAPSPRPGCRYFSNLYSNSVPSMGVDVSPTLGVAGAVYRVEHTYSSSAGNVSTDVIVGVTNTSGCTLSWTNTDKYQSAFGNSTWQILGYLTNNTASSTPVITFYFVGGTVSAGAQKRLEFDVWKFTLVQPCLAVAGVGLTGPLHTNVTSVLVTGATNATKITVYQDSGSGMVQIGALTSGIVNGNNSVPVSGLVYGARVAATQTVGGQEGCVPGTGLLVGGGPNPSIRIALSVRENTDLVGPAGSQGPGTNLNVYFIGASSSLGGGAPGDAKVLYPSNTWQTVTFTRGTDPQNPVDTVVLWNNGSSGDSSLDGNYGVLDGLGIACDGDPGSFQIYFDDFANGTNGVLQNFEAANNGQAAYLFSQPSFSGTTSGNLLSAPNDSVVVTNTAFSGSKCLRVQWQFLDGQTNRWLRLVTAGATPYANPEVDLNEPISLKVLLLPPGAVPPPGALSISLVGGQVVLNWAGSFPLQSATNVLGTYTDLGVTTGPYTNTSASSTVFYRLRGN
jgi:hypothetical protein